MSGAAVLDVALKEWAVVCDLLLAGRLTFLLRKGGIHESGGPGVFRLEHPRFVLFPSWAHQKPPMLKEPLRPRVQVLDEPATVTFQGVAEAAAVWPVTSRAALDTLDATHCWSRAYLDMRFGYKPEHPLYLVAVRCFRLRAPKTIHQHAAYSGCRSWFTLRPGDAVDDAGAEPVLDDAAFDQALDRIKAALT